MARYYIEVDGREVGLEVLHNESGSEIRLIDDVEKPQAISVDFAPVHSNVETGAGLYSLIADGRSYQVHVERTDDGLRMATWRNRFAVQVLTEREWRLEKVAPRQSQAGGRVTIKAPMPGLVKAVSVAQGDQVQTGQRLVVLEAMKMENEITAPSGGHITEVHITAGATVDAGKPLITLE